MDILVDGDWSEWGAWFSCSKECGGTQQRVRQCDDPKPRNGGQDCGEDFIQTRPCGGVCASAEGNISTFSLSNPPDQLETVLFLEVLSWSLTRVT